MAGHALGPKGRYLYVDDTGAQYNIFYPIALAIAETGLVADDAHGPPPRRFRLRGVWIESVEASPALRKFLICGVPTATAYNSNSPQPLNIDTVSFVTTGRRGERLSV